MLGPDESPRGVTYLLTFRPYAELPAGANCKYLAGDLRCCRFREACSSGASRRIAAWASICGWLSRFRSCICMNAGSGTASFGAAIGLVPGVRARRSRNLARGGPLRETDLTHRHARVHRYDDYLVAAKEHRIVHVLFSSRPDDIDLYYKPMARNTQLWTHDFQPLLDGPAADGDTIRRAAKIVQRRRPVRLSLPVSRHGRRPARSLLASPAGRFL